MAGIKQYGFFHNYSYNDMYPPEQPNMIPYVDNNSSHSWTITNDDGSTKTYHYNSDGSSNTTETEATLVKVITHNADGSTSTSYQNVSGSGHWVYSSGFSYSTYDPITGYKTSPVVTKGPSVTWVEGGSNKDQSNGGEEELPSKNLYKTGEVVKVNGVNYKLFDNKWIKLDNVQINVTALRTALGLGYVQPIGVKPIVEDAAIVRYTANSSLWDGLSLEVLLTGTGVQWIFERTVSFNPQVFIFLFEYNVYSGAYKRTKAMQEHDKEVEKIGK